MENCAYLRKNPGYAPVTHISFISLMWSRNRNIKPNLRLLLQWVYGINKPSSAIQSSSVNTDTEGAVGSVRIKLVEFRENLRASLPGDKANCP